MTYNSLVDAFDREHIYIVEIDLEYCQLTHGTLPCTATETGDAKCFNTRPSCNDLANYDDNAATPSVKTYRFCSSTSPQPIGLDAIPSLESLSMAASEIDINGGLGIRASVSMTFNDHPGSDITFNEDKYINDRTYIALERGTFWSKLRARNSNYENRTIRIYSGFLENGVYDAGNFKVRYYLIDSFDMSNGKVRISGKDPLKLAMANKAQCPTPTSGKLSGALLAATTTITMGTDEANEYEAATGGDPKWVVIGNEIIQYTGKTASTLTGCTRGQFNTVARDHSNGASVQQVYRQDGVDVDVIVTDLLVNYAGIDSSFIATGWATEADDYLQENLTGTITKPTDVFKLLKELAASAPHYLYWDEESNKIQFAALKSPPDPQFLSDLTSDNMIADTVRVKDLPKMRYSTVLVNCAPFDPTKKVDEESNYQLSYVRIDSDSLRSYGSNQIKKINSRWIGITGLGAAIKIATLYGRRFANIPREIIFSVDPSFRVSSDEATGVGQTRLINFRDITDFTGNSTDTVFQILSEQEVPNRYKYKALEFAYGQELAGDSQQGSTDVYIPVPSGSDPATYNVNLRALYDTQVGDGDITGEDINVKFILNNNQVVSSTSNSTPALQTGDWTTQTPNSLAITLEIRSGAIVCGYGGAGGSNAIGEDGGLALLADIGFTLINNGIIGGGGGGGGGADEPNIGSTGGGGGAGFGAKGTALNDPTATIIRQAVDGTATLGGIGAKIEDNADPLDFVVGGKGGDLGAVGATGGNSTGLGTNYAGGSAGGAIDNNGNTIIDEGGNTVDGTTYGGDIRGSVGNL